MTVSLLVNGRTPSPPSFCALCCEPIRENYLREVATRLCYCDYGCYRDHCDRADQAFENYAKKSVFVGGGYKMLALAYEPTGVRVGISINGRSG